MAGGGRGIRAALLAAVALGIALLLASGSRGGAQPQAANPTAAPAEAHRIPLHAGPRTPARGIDVEAIRRQPRLGSGRDAHLVLQFHALPDAPARRALRRRGIRLDHYLGGAAYSAVTRTAGLATRLRALPGVRAATALRPRDKQGPSLRAGRIPAQARTASGKLTVNVAFHGSVALASAQAAVERLGGATLDRADVLHAITARIPERRIDALAALDGVAYLDVAQPRPAPKLNRVRSTLGVGPLTDVPGGVRGAGVTGLIVDMGVVDQGHPDFAGRIAGAEAGMLAGEHATHVGGIFAGSGANSVAEGGRTGQWRGIAPEAALRSADGIGADWYFSFGDLKTDLAAALGPDGRGADLATMSLGDTAVPGHPCPVLGDYTLASQLVDQVTTGAVSGRALPFFLAAGNERILVDAGPSGPMMCQLYNTVVSPATAKNATAVGATNVDGDPAAGRRMMPGFSSFGPTDDGRIKPDLTAPGCSARSPAITSTSFADAAPPDAPDGSPDGYRQASEEAGTYAAMCGTSMSAPAAAGVGALLTELWQRTEKTPPAPHTLKAMMIHTAAEPPAGQGFRLGATDPEQRPDETVAPAPGAPGPDLIYGWGMLDGGAAGALVKDHKASPRIRVGALDHGDRSHWAFESDGSAAPKVTLAWDDPAATPLSARTLVNDLDVQLVSPSGKTYDTWTIDPAPALPASRADERHHAPAVRGKDARNNVEQATGAAEAGRWIVRVTGAAVAQGPQAFTLVMPAGGANDAPVAAPGERVTDEDGEIPLALAGTDPQGDSLRYALVSGPEHGTLTGTAPALIYRPRAGFAGEDRLTFRVTDPEGQADTASVRIRVRPVNDAPVSRATTLTATEGEAAAIDLAALAGDEETAAGDLTHTIVRGPATGALTGAGARRAYTPADGPGRTDELRFTVTDRGDPDGCRPGAAERTDDCDVARTSAAAKVTVTVLERNDPPRIADDGPASVSEDGTVDVAVLGNDHAGEPGQRLAVTAIAATPAHGTATIAPDGRIRYVPARDFAGEDTLRYRACDDGTTAGTADPRCGEAALSLAVTPVNDAPTVTLAGAASVGEGAALPVAASAADADGDALTYDWTVAGGELTGSGASVAVAGADGPGEIAIEVTVRDGHGGAATARRTVRVDNSPPVASAGPDLETPWGVPVELRARELADPSPVDAAALAGTWSFGDDTPDRSGLTVQHTYARPGTYAAALSVRDRDGGLAQDGTAVRVRRRASAVALESPTTVPSGPVTLRARLTDATPGAAAKVAGRAVTFALAGAEHIATTDADGVATVAAPPAPGGATPVTVRFAGDDWYEAASTRVSIDVADENADPVVSLDAPGAVDEGAAAVPLRASAFDPDGDPLTYEWRATGAALSSGGASASLAAADGPADVTVTVTVRDGHGGTGADTKVVRVRNVAPTGSAGPDLSVPWGTPLALGARDVRDPSVADAASLAVGWAFGDGTEAAGAAVTHAFAAPGRHVARLTVRDRDGAVAEDETTVDVVRRASAVRVVDPGVVPFGPVRVSARLADAADPGATLAGRAVTFTIAGAPHQARTGADGVATVALEQPPPAGASSVAVRFDGDDRYAPAADGATLRTGNASGRVRAKDLRLAGGMRLTIDAKATAARVTGSLRTASPALRSKSLTALAVAADGRGAWLAGTLTNGRAFVARLEESGARGRVSLWMAGAPVKGAGPVKRGTLDVRAGVPAKLALASACIRSHATATVTGEGISRVQWRVDGRRQPPGDRLRLEASALRAGRHTLIAVVDARGGRQTLRRTFSVCRSG